MYFNFVPPTDVIYRPLHNSQGCQTNQFECTRGVNVQNPSTNCITSNWKCDGVYDCSDKSDETTLTNCKGI